MRGRLRTVGVSVFLLAALLLSGCAGFAEKRPPVYTYAQIPQPEQAWVISHDAKVIAWGEENRLLTQRLEEEIQKVLPKSGVFSKISAAPGAVPHHVSFRLEMKTNKALGYLSGFVSGLTLLILPGFERDHYTLTADVRRGAEGVKQYVYEDRLDIWTEILLAPLLLTHFPNDVSRDLIDHLLLKFVHDLSADRLLADGNPATSLPDDGAIAEPQPEADRPEAAP